MNSQETAHSEQNPFDRLTPHPRWKFHERAPKFYRLTLLNRKPGAHRIALERRISRQSIPMHEGPYQQIVY